MSLFNGGKGRGKTRGQEGYGRGEVAIHFNDDVLVSEDDLRRALLDYITAPDYEPPTLPKVAIDLMQLSQQPDVEMKDVVALLEQDSMIAGRVLQRVQSPIYSGATKITSLHDAVGRIGLRALRDLVAEIAMNLKVYKSDDYSETMELLRRHATATAHLCRLISRYTSLEGDYAFMAGLLHDVGIAGLLLALSDGKGRRKTPPDLIAIWPAVDRVHAKAGELMTKKWELPAELQMPIESHHQVLIQGYPHPLAATVCLADHLAHELGCGVVPNGSAEDEFDDASADAEPSVLEIETDCLRGMQEIDRSGPRTIEQTRETLMLKDETIGLIRSEAETLIAELD